MSQQEVSASSTPAESSKPTNVRRQIMGVLMITLLTAYLDRVNVSVLIADPAFVTDLGLKGNPVRMGMMMTSFLITYGLANVFLAPLGDWIGARKTMCTAICLWIVACFSGGLVSTFSAIVAVRLFLGLGEGMYTPTPSRYVKNWFPPLERGKANAISLVGVYAGPALSMPFFTWLIKSYGWRNSFFVLAVVSFIPLILLWKWTADHPEQSKRVNKAELNYIQKGMTAEREAEARMGHSTFSENLKYFISSYRYWLLVIFYICQGMLFWGMMAWLPSYLKTARGFSWAAMGVLSALPYMLGTVLVLLCGYLSDKTGRRAIWAAIGTFAAALGIYIGINTANNLSAALVISVGYGMLGMGLPIAWVLLQQFVPGRAVATGAGIMNGISQGSSAAAPVLIGYFIAVSGGYVGGLMFIVAVAVIGGLCVGVLAYQKY